MFAFPKRRDRAIQPAGAASLQTIRKAARITKAHDPRRWTSLCDARVGQRESCSPVLNETDEVLLLRHSQTIFGLISSRQQICHARLTYSYRMTDRAPVVVALQQAILVSCKDRVYLQGHRDENNHKDDRENK